MTRAQIEIKKMTDFQRLRLRESPSLYYHHRTKILQQQAKVIFFEISATNITKILRVVKLVTTHKTNLTIFETENVPREGT